MTDRVAPAVVTMRAWGQARDWRAYDPYDTLNSPLARPLTLGTTLGAIVPEGAVDGASLPALADISVVAGGTVNREWALLGTPTCTVFAGRLGAVDAALIEAGLLRDLRKPASSPAFVTKTSSRVATPSRGSDVILTMIMDALALAASYRGSGVLRPGRRQTA